MPLIEKVCSQHPEMHLQIREEGSAVLHELLINGRIELSISPTRPDNDLVLGEQLLSEPLMLMYPASWSISNDAPGALRRQIREWLSCVSVVDPSRCASQKLWQLSRWWSGSGDLNRDLTLG